MPDVGTLNINLKSEHRELRRPAGQVRAGKPEMYPRGIQEEFDKVDLSEARGGIMVFGEELGIHLPRHVQTLIVKFANARCRVRSRVFLSLR